MADTTPIKKFLDKPMSRKQFLAHVGATALAVTGVAGVIKNLSDLHSTKVTRGYGAANYGGKDKPSHNASALNSQQPKV